MRCEEGGPASESAHDGKLAPEGVRDKDERDVGRLMNLDAPLARAEADLKIRGRVGECGVSAFCAFRAASLAASACRSATRYFKSYSFRQIVGQIDDRRYRGQSTADLLAEDPSGLFDVIFGPLLLYPSKFGAWVEY